MLRTILAAMLAAVCAKAQAQVVVSDAQFASELGKVFAQSVSAGRSFEQAAPVRLLDRVMIAMYDAPGTGEMIVQWLRDNRAVVEFSDLVMEGRSAHAWLGDFVPEPRKPAVYITPLLLKPPVSYRLLGALIAKEGSELMLKDFPESAEKRYITASRMAETYFELGGTRIALPDFDGTIDEDAADTIRIWIENAPDSGVQVLKERGFKTLKEAQADLLSEEARLANLHQAIEQMISVHGPDEESLRAELACVEKESARTARKLDAAKKAEDEFKRFKEYETDWLMSHRPS
ncbi:MAG: hypothetical protein HY922_12990 [Elusimicrobia bacterium]|nr:hypothetical protein [Elusimicrobiota bacterium]